MERIEKKKPRRKEEPQPKEVDAHQEEVAELLEHIDELDKDLQEAIIDYVYYMERINGYER